MDLNTKYKIIDEIRNHVDVFKPVPPIRYRIRCPYCGDSQKKLTDAHCYIKCSNDPDEPLQYKCFLANCGAKGIITSDFLERLGITTDYSKELNSGKYNKIRVLKESNVNIITGEPIPNSKQIEYIENRLGKGFTLEDYDKFKIIWDIDIIRRYVSSEKILNTLPSNNNSISFLSDDKSSILIRSFYNDSRWRKIKLFGNDDSSVYIIKTQLDIFTQDPIEVNIAEGIFDILSVYKNFNTCENSVFIAVLGSDYVGGVNYSILKGIFGKNVTIKIYIDDNVDHDKLKYKLKKFKWLFNKIKLFRNTKGKDVGVKIENIELKEIK